MWILVEFVGDKEIYSNYSVVNIDELVSKDGLCVGKNVFVRIKETFAQQALVIRVSGLFNYIYTVNIKMPTFRVLEHHVNLLATATTYCVLANIGVEISHTKLLQLEIKKILLTRNYTTF